MARTRWVLARVFALCLGVAVAAAPVPAAALAPVGTGWWWRAQAGLLVDVPHPPQVPEDGLYVEGAPDGPSAVAALRFRVPEHSVGIGLVLQVADERNGEEAVLLVCPAAGPWVPAHGGRWDARPEAACEGQGVPGQRAPDGASWTFALNLLSFSGARDLVLLPGVDDTRPEGVNGSVFAVAFEPPGESALITEDADMRDGQPPRPPVFVPPTDTGGAPPLFGGAPQGTVQDTPQPADEAAPELAPRAGDPSVIPPRVSTPPEPVPGRPVPAGKDARALAALVALLSVGVAGVLSRDRLAVVPGISPAPPGTEAREGGIGRFRRPRSTPPPPL